MLFASDVALFLRGIYMKIEFLRLDLHLKRKQKKKPQGQHQRVHQRRKKKKKNPETVAQRPRSRCDLGSPRDLGRGATWIYRARPMSSAWIWHGLGRLELISISSSSSSLSFFFLSFCVFFRCFCILGYILALMFYFWVRNRVLETQFPCRRHLEKVPRKRQTTHENRALKTRFRSPKSSL